VRAAPLKGDCVICQAPEPTRVAINAAIWPGDGMMRSVTYRADGVEVAQTSGVPELAKMNVKTITRHAEHIEASWREVPQNGRLHADEAPVKADFLSVTDLGARLGALGLKAMGDAIEQDPMAWALLRPKETIAAAKVGLTASVAAENSRLKRNQQAIDVMAIFAMSSGHAPVIPTDELDDVPLDVLRAAIGDERKQLAARNE